MKTKARATQRPKYREGVEWIAMNDDPGSSDSLDLEAVAGYISTHLLADLYGMDYKEVGRDVINFRTKERKGSK